MPAAQAAVPDLPLWPRLRASRWSFASLVLACVLTPLAWWALTYSDFNGLWGDQGLPFAWQHYTDLNFAYARIKPLPMTVIFAADACFWIAVIFTVLWAAERWVFRRISGAMPLAAWRRARFSTVGMLLLMLLLGASCSAIYVEFNNETYTWSGYGVPFMWCQIDYTARTEPGPIYAWHLLALDVLILGAVSVAGAWSCDRRLIQPRS